jgi:hypothetical protein
VRARWCVDCVRMHVEGGRCEPRSAGFVQAWALPGDGPGLLHRGHADGGAVVRQVLGAIAQFEKASLVAKLKAARDRKIAQGIKCGGRKTYAERSPELVAAAKALRAERPRLSLRKIAARRAGLHGRLRRAVCSDVGAGNAARVMIPAPLAGSPPSRGRGGQWKAARPHTYPRSAAERRMCNDVHCSTSR